MPKAVTRSCPRCQSMVPTETQFCPSCGLSLVQSDREALELRQMKARERSGFELRTIIIVFIVIVALGYYFLR